MLTGRVGQVLGPFDAGVDLLTNDGPIGKETPESTTPILLKLGIQAPTDTVVQVNDAEIKVGKTGIYELDEVVAVKKLVFPNGADDSTIVDFVY